MPPILYLIDGHALAYRTYFALMTAGGERFQTHKGEPTAGSFGFTSVLLRILEQDQPEYLAVSFDTGKTFRNERYPSYKATRAKMPDDLRAQIERIRQIVDAFHIPRLEVEGYEADDVIGTVARQAAKQGFGVKIITGDRDLLQLVTDRIIVSLSGKKISEAKDYFPRDVEEFLGVLPEQVVDYKALVGDTSDNIPGVSGIGEQTAITLYKQYKTLDDVYAHLDDIAPRFRTKLEKGKDQAYLSRELATIRTDAPITLNLEDARVRLGDVAEIEEIFRELEFRTLTGRLKNIRIKTGDLPSGQQQLELFGEKVERVGEPSRHDFRYHTVDTPEALASLRDRIEKAKILSIDTETTSTDPLRAEIVGFSLAFEAGEGFYVPLGHHTKEQQLTLEQVRDALQPLFKEKTRTVIGHNLKYDSLVLERSGLGLGRLDFDTMIAEWLVDPGSRHLGLKDMAEAYLNVDMTHIEELIGKGSNQISMADVPIEKVAPYASADAEVPMRLQPILMKKLTQQNALRVFNEVEMPLIPVLAGMEEAGILLDVPFLEKMSKELDQRLQEIEKDVYKTIGYTFNLNSTQQLSVALFEKMNLKPPDARKKTSSGHYSTSAAILEQMQGQHPVVDQILEYRELAKLKSTYVDSLPQQINPQTGRVHTSFNQTGSVTGRLASVDPNLQNIPTRTDLGRRVRQAFVSGRGQVLLSVDYSQIELRIVAHMSGDEAMLKAFRKGEDIHAATAAAVLGIPIEKVTREQRRNAKAINFGLIYGMSAFGMSSRTELTLAESENFVKAYFEQFPKVKSYLDQMRKLAAQQGYVETLLGRRRYFPDLKGQTNVNIRNREEREAINAPIQGSAADIIKMAMIRLPDELRKKKLESRLLLQVHDELILECPSEEVTRAAKVVQETMENTIELAIPLETEARWGKNWGEMQPMEKFKPKK